jgi:DNA-binding transcriptional LysR family regulator
MYDWAEFRHFRYLLKILEKGGFRAAAEELYTSQPNLTVQARQFQDQASVRLFRRLKNGQIRPTETGIAFIALARLLLEVREEVINALIAIERGEVSMVRFGSTPLADQKLFRTLCALHKELLPTCGVRPTHGDAGVLAQEVAGGIVDAAIITLPLKHPELHIELLRHDRMVVCLRREDPLARKAALETADLRANLTVFYDPQRHPEAHTRPLELLIDAGISVPEYSRASHPSEMQALVKEGHGQRLQFLSLSEGIDVGGGPVPRLWDLASHSLSLDQPLQRDRARRTRGSKQSPAQLLARDVGADREHHPRAAGQTPVLGRASSRQRWKCYSRTWCGLRLVRSATS